MSANAQRSLVPEHSVNEHAQLLSSDSNDLSSMHLTPIKQESQSPSCCREPGFSHSTSLVNLADNDRNAHYIQPARKSGHKTFSNNSSDSDMRVNRSSSPACNSCPELRLTPTRGDTHTSLIASADPVSPPLGNSQEHSPPPCSVNSGFKLRLRGIQAAIRESPYSREGSFLKSDTSLSRKRSSRATVSDNEFDTDSEIDIMPQSRKIIKLTVEKPAVRNPPRKAKKVKTAHDESSYEDDEFFDAGDEASSPTASPARKLVLSSNVLKRSERMLDPANPDHAKLIAVASKAGSEYYDSDDDELPGNVKETNKPHLFRNVKWGGLAVDYSNHEDFTTEPEFTQFVPGRFERLPDGTASDQKHKLIIKLTDKQHRQRIFLNPPPRDWNDQEAITALNKRTVQQIRRNTSVRFREVVEPYVMQEREWILAHLTDGKPSSGWKKFVNAFNQEFEGKLLVGCKVARPERSHSSLTKEVERFGTMYAKGVVPKAISQGNGLKKGRK